MRFKIKVVLPLPKNPVTMVTGMGGILQQGCRNKGRIELEICMQGRYLAGEGSGWMLGSDAEWLDNV